MIFFGRVRFFLFPKKRIEITDLKFFFSALQPIVSLSPLRKEAIDWWQGRTSSYNENSPKEEAPIILISDDESIGRGSKTKFNESDDYSTIPIKKYPRKRTTFRNAIKKLNFCDCCLYETRNKSHFNRHLNSATHKANRRIQSDKSEKLARNTSR